MPASCRRRRRSWCRAPALHLVPSASRQRTERPARRRRGQPADRGLTGGVSSRDWRSRLGRRAGAAGSGVFARKLVARRSRTSTRSRRLIHSASARRRLPSAARRIAFSNRPIRLSSSGSQFRKMKTTCASSKTLRTIRCRPHAALLPCALARARPAAVVPVPGLADELAPAAPPASRQRRRKRVRWPAQVEVAADLGDEVDAHRMLAAGVAGEQRVVGDHADRARNAARTARASARPPGG